jgi:hypothetical protein
MLRKIPSRPASPFGPDKTGVKVLANAPAAHHVILLIRDGSTANIEGPGYYLLDMFLFVAGRKVLTPWQAAHVDLTPQSPTAGGC